MLFLPLGTSCSPFSPPQTPARSQKDAVPSIFAIFRVLLHIPLAGLLLEPCAMLQHQTSDHPKCFWPSSARWLFPLQAQPRHEARTAHIREVRIFLGFLVGKLILPCHLQSNRVHRKAGDATYSSSAISGNFRARMCYMRDRHFSSIFGFRYLVYLDAFRLSTVPSWDQACTDRTSAAPTAAT